MVEWLHQVKCVTIVPSDVDPGSFKQLNIKGNCIHKLYFKEFVFILRPVSKVCILT